jgi:4-hydroxythreonine-4-phosphate dehydrogenase
MIKNLPILITLGDPNGVGPRLSVRTAKAVGGRLVLVGDPAVVRLAAQAEGLAIESIEELSSPEQVPKPGRIAVWAPPGLEAGDVEPGQTTRWAGSQALLCVDAATDLCLQGKARAMVTAPLSKESVALTLPGFNGHTGHIAKRCGVEAHCLSLNLGRMWAAFVTTHIALADVPAHCTRPAIMATARLLHEALVRTGIVKPRIGLAGLNPHAGEHGLFGREEIEVITPAATALRSEGLDISDPLPADVVFPLLKAGKFDGVVSLYHDQGHPVMKTLGFDLKKGILRGVNVTLGLPIVRTSPDHGTGFDIAWHQAGNDSSLRDALRLAKRLTR